MLIKMSLYKWLWKSDSPTTIMYSLYTLIHDIQKASGKLGGSLWPTLCQEGQGETENSGESTALGL